MKLLERLAHQLRHLIGPDPKLSKRLFETEAKLRLEQERGQREHQRRLEMSEKAERRQIEIDRLQAELIKQLNVEPGPAEGCTKVRLRGREEAWDFARRVAEETSADLEGFYVYPCQICPRQPTGVGRFLHITNDVKGQARSDARKRHAAQRHVNGTSLADRIDPAVLAKLKGG